MGQLPRRVRGGRRRLRDSDTRLEKLFRTYSESAPERARAILAENAAYNFGTAMRTVNLPTLPLLFLHPRNRGRFSFHPAGVESVAGIDARVVAFEEIARPSLVREGDRADDLPAAGRFWIDAMRGTILRSETRFRFGRDAVAELVTDYAPQPKLAMWVPVEMRERYEDLPGGARPVFGSPTTGVAHYSNFRRFVVTRFVVTSQENAAIPEK